MRTHLFRAALTMCLVMISGAAVAQTPATCDEIQRYTAAGVPDSPLVSQLVTVTGTIYVQPGTFNGGSHYIMDATGGLTFYLSGTGLVVGDEIEVTGTVDSFNGSEIDLSGASISPATGVPLTPVVMTVPEVMSPDYETVGTFAQTVGTVVDINPGSPGVSNGDFRIIDGTTDTLMIFIDKDTMIDMTAIDVGDVYQAQGAVVNYSGLIEIKARMQADLIENPLGDTLPVIQNIECTNWVPMANDPIVVTADISDDNGVTSATLYYRTNDNEGLTPGSWSSVAMATTGGDAWDGTIPGQTSELVDFYVEATDTGAQTVTNPGNAPTGYYTVFIGIVSIYDMCTVHPDSSSQANNYNGLFVNVEGIITAGTGQAGANSKFIMQEADANPATGDYTFGGLLIYEGSAQGTYYRGDLVQVGGTGNEYFGLSQVLPHTGNAINLVSFGNTLPEPEVVRTRILGDDLWAVDDGTGNLGEAYESVWVKTHTSTVADTLGYGDYTVCDKFTAAGDTVIVGPLVTLAYQPILGDILTLEGFMDYDYGDRKIVPISDAFIVLSGATAVGDDTPTVVSAGGFQKIYPNPFNPTTKISFAVNRDELVQLNFYNIRGEKVRTLVSDRLPAADYTFEWDGKNDAGSHLASGTYFARLRIGAEVMQVRKVALVK
ncbi:MAG: hypothetical protein GY838_16020 [bacterium]|nr:hypothetical protein [bacterium]